MQSAERIVATMPVEGNRQSLGLLHGGASVALGEMLGSWAAVIHGSTMGKVAVGARDSSGFIVNRILLPMINEAVFVLGQGTAGIADIDAAARLGLNHPMGPLQLADFIGLDTCLEIVRVLHASTGDSKYRPCPLLAKYVAAGWLGRKSGRGFYDYSGPTPVPTR